jgi:hypothetical protein
MLETGQVELKDFQSHLDDRFDRLEAKLDSHDEKLSNHLERLSKAEEAISWLRGHVKLVVTIGISVVGALMSAVLKYGMHR